MDLKRRTVSRATLHQLFNRRCQSCQTLFNLRLWPGRKSKDECRIQVSLDAEERKRPAPNGGFLTSTHQKRQIFPAPQPRDEVQTGWRHFQIEIVAQPLLELFNKEYASLGIEFADPFHMAEKESFSDEPRQGSLINRRGMLVHNSAHLDEGVDKIWRCDQKTETERWIKDFAHRAGINHPAGIVQTLKTWQRRPIEAKLGIVIIFQDVAVARLRELNQCFAPLKAHRHTEGKLVRWCDENESGRILPRALPDYQPLTIDRAWDSFGPDKSEDITRHMEAGILNPTHVALID